MYLKSFVSTFHRYFYWNFHKESVGDARQIQRKLAFQQSRRMDRREEKPYKPFQEADGNVARHALLLLNRQLDRENIANAY